MALKTLKDKLNGPLLRSLSRNLSRPSIVVVTLMICITQEVFVILELWEPCLNRINFQTYEDADKRILLPAISIGIKVDEYLDYLLNDTNHENHYHPMIRTGQAEKRRQSIKDEMLPCVEHDFDFKTDWNRYVWYQTCIFSVSHQLNISIYDLFDSLLFGDWSHDHLFKMTAWLNIDNNIYSMRTTQGYLGMYMAWTFFTDSGTTRYSTSKSIYNQTSGVRGEVFDSYDSLSSNGIYLVLQNADQATAEKYFFKYYIAVHSPTVLWKMDDFNQPRYLWDSSKDFINLPITISHHILVQKRCMLSDDGSTTRGAACREYLPSLDDGEDHEVHDDPQTNLTNWQCNLDPTLYTCYTQPDCEEHLYFSNPAHTCLQDRRFRRGVPFHHLKSILRSAAKGVGCVDKDEFPSNGDNAEERNQYFNDRINDDVCPPPCHVIVHRLEVPYRQTYSRDEPTWKFIIHKSREETYLTVELFPPTTWVQLLVNIFAVAGTWYGLSFYGGLMNAPVWLSTSWKYVTDKKIFKLQFILKSLLTSSSSSSKDINMSVLNDRFFIKTIVKSKSNAVAPAHVHDCQ